MQALIKGVVEEIGAVLGDMGLASRLPPGPSLRLDEVTRESAASLASPAQRNLLYACTSIAARTAPRLAPLVLRTRERLSIEESFCSLLERAFDSSEALRRPVPIATLFFETPADTAAAIRSIIRRHQRLGAISSKKKLTGLCSELYEQPDDRLAISVLQQLPLFDKVAGFVSDKLAALDRLRHMSSHIEVTAEAMPELHTLYRIAGETLELDKLPPLYIAPGALDAYTLGTDEPIVVITQPAASLLTPSELLFMLGHELGHVKSRHVLYTTIAYHLNELADLAGQVSLGIGTLAVNTTLRAAVQLWQRRAEVTADRAGLLACQDPRAAISCLAKLAGLPVALYGDFTAEDFLRQANRLDSAMHEAGLERAAMLLDVLSSDHPWQVSRAAALHQWVESGEYNDILEATPAQRAYLKTLLASDPFAAPFIDDLVRGIASWATEKHGCDAARARAESRRMLRLGVHPTVSPLSAIYTVDIEMKWAGSGQLQISVLVLALQDGRPVLTTLQLSDLHHWSQLPAQSREALLRQGRSSATFRLYKKQG